MGCVDSKSKGKKVHPLTTSRSSSRDNTVSLRTSTSNGRSTYTKQKILFHFHIGNTIISARDFNITHTDFIAEKSGRINDDYKLLLPPIGRGTVLS